MQHVPQAKNQEVRTLIELIDSHPVVGLVDMEGIKSRQLQRIRQDLRDKAVIRASKNTLLAIALKKSKKKLETLSPCLRGGASLICTDLDPFRLYMLLERSRTPAPARPGDTAPEDIVIAAGDTGFPPGPLVGELQRAGVPARIEKGSIIVQNDHVFVKAGQTITEKQAEILAKLGMEPMVTGLELLGVCEEGRLYEPSVLHVDTEQFTSKIGQAYKTALNVGVEACIITETTITLLIQKGVLYSTSLALEAGYVSRETLPHLLAKGVAHGQILENLMADPVGGPSPEAKRGKKEPKEKDALEGALSG